MPALKALMESRMVEIEFPTKEVLCIHAAAIIGDDDEKPTIFWGIIKKRFGPVATKIDAKKVTKANENCLIKVSMSEADVLQLHGTTAFWDQRQALAKWVKKWITPTAINILANRPEYN